MFVLAFLVSEMSKNIATFFRSKVHSPHLSSSEASSKGERDLALRKELPLGGMVVDASAAPEFWGICDRSKSVKIKLCPKSPKESL